MQAIKRLKPWRSGDDCREVAYVAQNGKAEVRVVVDQGGRHQVVKTCDTDGLDVEADGERVYGMALMELDNVQKCLGFDSEAKEDQLTMGFSFSPDIVNLLYMKCKNSQSKLPEALVSKIMKESLQGGLSLERSSLWHPHIDCDSIFLEDGKFKLTNPFLNDSFVKELSGLNKKSEDQKRQIVLNHAAQNVNELGISLLKITSLSDDSDMVDSTGNYKKDSIRESLRIANLNYSSELVGKIENMIKGRNHEGVLTFETLVNGTKPRANQSQNTEGTGSRADHQNLSADQEPLFQNQYSTIKPKKGLAKLVWGGNEVIQNLGNTQEDYGQPTNEPIFRNDVTAIVAESQRPESNCPLIDEKRVHWDTQLGQNKSVLQLQGNTTKPRPGTILDVTQEIRSNQQSMSRINNGGVSMASRDRLGDTYHETDASRWDVRGRTAPLWQPTIVEDEGVEVSTHGMYPPGYRNDFTERVPQEIQAKVRSLEVEDDDKSKSYYRNKIGQATAEVLKAEGLDIKAVSGMQMSRNNTVNDRSFGNRMGKQDTSMILDSFTTNSLSKKIMLGSNDNLRDSRGVDELNMSRKTNKLYSNSNTSLRKNPVLAFANRPGTKRIFDDSDDEANTSKVVNLSNAVKDPHISKSIAGKIWKDVEERNSYNNSLEISAIHPVPEKIKHISSVPLPRPAASVAPNQNLAHQILDGNRESLSQKISNSRSASLDPSTRVSNPREILIPQPINSTGLPHHLKPSSTHTTPSQQSHTKLLSNHTWSQSSKPGELAVTRPTPSIDHTGQPVIIRSSSTVNYRPANTPSNNYIIPTPQQMLRSIVAHQPRPLAQKIPAKIEASKKIGQFESMDSRTTNRDDRQEPTSIYQWHADSKEYWKYSVDGLGNRNLVGISKTLPTTS